MKTVQSPHIVVPSTDEPGEDEPPGRSIDTPLELSVGGCRPGDQVHLSAWMNDAYGSTWRSRASFRADSEGRVDISSSAPESGTYDEPDASGLLWSMEKQEDASDDPVQRVDHVEKRSSYSVDICLEAGEVRQRVRLNRWVRPDHVQMKRLDGPVQGMLFFEPDAGPRPTVLFFGGSNGLARTPAAAYLASKGYNTVAVPYFLREGLPSALDRVPLEYFFDAIDWCKAQPFVDADRVALHGTSRGAEAALLVAAERSDIRAVVAQAPTLLVRPGIDEDGYIGIPAWSRNGQPVPYASTLLGGSIHASLRPSEPDQVTMKDRFVSGIFAWSLQHAEAFAQAQIPVEKINASTLFISGTDDQVWPSTLFGEVGVERMKRAGRSLLVSHCVCERAGHSITLPNVPVSPPTVKHVTGCSLSLGGIGTANAQAAHQSWQATVDFLEKALSQEFVP